MTLEAEAGATPGESAADPALAAKAARLVLKKTARRLGWKLGSGDTVEIKVERPIPLRAAHRYRARARARAAAA